MSETTEDRKRRLRQERDRRYRERQKAARNPDATPRTREPAPIPRPVDLDSMCAFVVGHILRAGEAMQQSDDATLSLTDGRIVDGATYCATVLKNKWLPALVQFQAECSPEANQA